MVICLSASLQQMDVLEHTHDVTVDGEPVDTEVEIGAE